MLISNTFIPMQRYTILWADDEIDLLKPHILFLKNKGYDITPVNSGSDALDLIEKEYFDLVFLDENMPGMSGLETLARLKNIRPSLPVVMITKSEEESIMEEAIGSKITDYLIKPLNPSQILLSAKKILDNKRLISEKTNMGYQQEFRQLAMTYQDRIDFEAWVEIYKKLVYWELEIDKTVNKGMAEVLEMQKDEANANFTKFIVDEYRDWLHDNADAPLLSHQLMKQRVFPELQASSGKPTFFILIDNLRLDQWKVIEPVISNLFNVEREENYYSILPTTTAYSRNAIFAGMTPLDIAKRYPSLWVSDDDEDGKNLHEEELLVRQMQKERIDKSMCYHKITQVQQGKQLLDQFPNLLNNDLVVLVFNFVDMLSHARTDLQMIRELAPDESAYRSLTLSWFEHSSLLEVLKKIAAHGSKVILTTDHGTIRVKKPYRIIGDRNTNTNLRYKQGKNLGYDRSDKLMTVPRPEDYYLPKPNVSTSYVFASSDYFFAYPNNYNYYVNYFKDTFQHGGISMEEMIIPLVFLSPK
jgi:CheY-like chemotaxis protein